MLCDDSPCHANTILDHIAAFTTFSRHDIRLYNPRSVRGSVFLDLNDFDVVVIHYSLYILSDHYLSSNFKEKLKHFRGLKIQFIQDDYRRIDEFAALMRNLGIHILFTLYPAEQIPKVWDEYRLPGVLKFSTLAGYIPERLVSLNVPPTESRPTDIGYRGRRVPYWLGQFGQEKMWIGQGVLDRAEEYGLRCDIAWREEDRIYGEDWNRFISSCKATLGTESGASITDFDGSIEQKVKQYLAKHRNASFEEVHRHVLQPHENNVPIKVISPRMFEAITLRTALILFPGQYSKILEPWVHYIPLEREFSNLDEVVTKLRDAEFLRSLTDRAYRDIVTSGRYSFRSFISEFDEIVTKYANLREKKSPTIKTTKMRYRLSRWERLFSLRFGLVVRLIGTLLEAHIETYLALTFILRTPTIRSIFANYLRNFKKFRSVQFGTLLKELLLLDILRKAQDGTLRVREPFTVVVQFSPGEGAIHVTSQPAKGMASIDQNGLENEASVAVLWPVIYSVLLDGQIKTMVWDHSALEDNFLYRKLLFMWIAIRIGDDGVRHFSNLVKITTRPQ